MDGEFAAIFSPPVIQISESNGIYRHGTRPFPRTLFSLFVLMNDEQVSIRSRLNCGHNGALRVHRFSISHRLSPRHHHSLRIIPSSMRTRTRTHTRTEVAMARVYTDAGFDFDPRSPPDLLDLTQSVRSRGCVWRHLSPSTQHAQPHTHTHVASPGQSLIPRD